MAGRLPLAWGTTSSELLRDYPADALVEGAVVTMTRAVAVDAPVEVTWRWACQLALAPYSYDWIDNRGRRSPRQLVPGTDQLTPGQTMVAVFKLVSFDAPHHWTGVSTPSAARLFGRFAATYAVTADPDHPCDPARSRLVCRMVAEASTRLTRLRGQAFAWGDLVMMRKQLLTLKSLAEAR